MASGKVKGISIEIGGNTVGLTKALEDVNKQTNAMQNELKQVERLLKLDPKNTELLAQKQELLGNEIAITKEKLETLKEAEKQAQQQFQNGKISEEQYRALQREIVATEQNLKGLEEQSKKNKFHFDSLGTSAEKMNNAVKNITLGAVGVTGGLVAMGMKAAQSADDINTLATQTGLTTDEIQKFQYASELIDVPLETLTGSMAKLTRNMASAQNGSKNVQNAFSQLGVAYTDNEGKLRNNQDVFDEVITALSQMENETQRDAYAMQIFGKSAQDLNPLIKGGADSLKQLGKEAEEAGLILDEDTLNAANELNDAVDKMKATATGAFAKIGSEVAKELTPMIEPAAKAIADFVSWIVDNKDGVISGLAGIGTALLAFNVVTIIQGLVKSFQAFKLANEGATAAQWLLNAAMSANPIAIVIAVITGLVAAFVVLWNKSDAFRNFWINLWDGIVSGTKAAIDGICKFFTETLPNAFKAVIDFVKNNWKELLLLLTNPIAGAIALLYKLNPKFKEWVDGLLAKIKAWFAGMKDIGKNILDGLWSGISNGTKWLLDKVKEWCGSIMKGIKAFFGIKSPSRVMRDEIGKMIDAGLAEGLEGNIDMVKSAMDNVGVTVINSAEDMRKGVADSLKSTVSEFDTAFGNIEKSRDGLAEKLRGENQFIDIHTVSINGQEVKRYNTLADYTDENSILSTYSGLLDQLNEKLGGEVPEALMENLRTMDASAGTEYVKIILDSTDEEIQNYIKGKSENELLSQSIAEKLYKPEFEELGNNIIDEIDKIPSNFAVAGEDSAETFGEGFMAQFKTVVNRIKETIGNTLNIPTAELSLVGGGNSNVVNTTINQTITATPDTAYTVAKETKKTMNGIIGMAVMR